MPDNPTALGIYFLDVGQGDCTFIVPPEGHGDPILFDCADAFVARCFVANHNITNLHAVVASHLDQDHILGILPFLTQHFEEGRRVGALAIGKDRLPEPGRNKAIRKLLAAARTWEREPPHDDFEVLPPFRTNNSALRLAERSGDWSVDLVLPFYGDTQSMNPDGVDPNMTSAVLRIERGGTVVVIGADAPLASWERLAPNLRAHVIRTPHHGGEIRGHGSTWETFEDLYDRVEADVAVVSVGSRFAHGHPFLDHANAARRDGACRLLCTQLTPRCHPDPTALRDAALNASQAVEPAYRHLGWPGYSPKSRPNEAPCAGSIVVSLGESGEMAVTPEAAESAHTNDLLPQVPHPACLGQGRPITLAEWRAERRAATDDRT